MAATHIPAGDSSQPSRIGELRRYTEFVGLSKRLLWALAAILVGVVLFFTMRNADDRVRLVFSAMPVGDPLAPMMVKPHYEGIDNQSQPYHITAEEAVQVDPEHIALTALHADMTLRDTSWLALTSGHGIFDSERKILALSEGVQMFYEGGYEFRTASADIDLNLGNATGHQPIEGQGPLGLLEADRFEITQKGKRLYFAGSVKMTLYP